MNSTNLAETLHQGFRITLGAASTLIEMLQDSQKRTENLQKMQSNFGLVVEEWAEKGALTEQEARNFVETILAQSSSPSPGINTPSTSSTVTTRAKMVVEPNSIQEIQELTAEVAALRTELERLRNSTVS